MRETFQSAFQENAHTELYVCDWPFDTPYTHFTWVNKNNWSDNRSIVLDNDELEKLARFLIENVPR